MLICVRRLGWLLIVMSLGLACGPRRISTEQSQPPTEAEMETTTTGETFIVKSNTQLTFESLRIGVAGIKPRDYVDAEGANRHGPTAGLWIFYREDSGQDRALNAYAGQLLVVAGYQIEVLDIDAEGYGSVELRITKPQPAETHSP